MEEVAAAPSEASLAQLTVVASPVYPGPHFTVQLESDDVVSDTPLLQGSVSPPTTPAPKLYAAQEFSAQRVIGVQVQVRWTYLHLHQPNKSCGRVCTTVAQSGVNVSMCGSKAREWL